MSQEKVDYRKEQKRNRKKILKKKRIEHIALATGGILVTAVLVVWIGISIHTRYEENKAANPTYYSIDASDLTEYLASLQESE